MGGPRIDYTPYVIADGQYRCSCGALLAGLPSLRQHWQRQPAHHPTLRPLTEKACTRCGEVLPLDAFSPRPGVTARRHSWCKACVRGYVRGIRSGAIPRRRLRPTNPRLDLALRLTRVGVCPACLLSLGDHAQCQACTRWLCAEETDFTRVCVDCAMEWVERPRRQQPAQRRPGRRAA